MSKRQPHDSEQGYFGITRSQEEDIDLLTVSSQGSAFTIPRVIALTVLSIVILGVYFTMNLAMFPDYPIVTPRAEEHNFYLEHYPPFRLGEWAPYTVTVDLLSGTLRDEPQFEEGHPLGYPLAAVPFVLKWGERGMYMTNAVILWLSAIVFLLLLLELTGFWTAFAATGILAFATPNLFFAASALPEPMGQLTALVSVYFFVRSFSASREWPHLLVSGLCAGLLLFVQPFLALSIIMLVAIVGFERGTLFSRDKTTLALPGGFLCAVIIYIAVNTILSDSFGWFAFSFPSCIYLDNAPATFPAAGNAVARLWTLLFAGPHGLLFIMPVVMLFPLGLIIMWRQELRSVALICGILVGVTILLATLHTCTITGDIVGSRHLLTVVPFMLIPLLYVWEGQLGERIWLGVTLAMTVYMCSFGWWAGVERGRGFWIGLLHDHKARAIILARKHRLDRPVFKTGDDIVGRYFRSLRRHDMQQWLETVAPLSITAMYGREREVFAYHVTLYEAGERDHDVFIERVDPDDGIRPVMHGMSGNGYGGDGNVRD